MKQTEFTKKDGSEGIEYKPEADDVIICKADSVYSSEPRAVIVDKDKETERAVNIVTHGISALWNDKEIFCKLTEGQKKVLDKVEDLMDKSVKFENYESKNYGTLVGARILKEEKENTK